MCRVVVCSVLLPLQSLAQPTPVLQHYSVDEGLPSSEVYQTIQDERGYIWLATDRGLSCFDGNMVRNFTTDDGLPDNSVRHLFEAADGRLWLVTRNNLLACVVADTIAPYPHNEVIARSIDNPLLSSFMVDTTGTVHMGFMYDGYLKIDTAGIPQYIQNAGVSAGLYLRTIEQRLFHFGVRGSATNATVALESGFRFFKLKQQEERTRYFLVQRRDSTIAYAEQNHITMVGPSGDTLETEFDRRINGLYEDSHGSFWVSFFKGGMKRYVGLEIRPESRGSMLPDKSVTSVYEDQEGGLWLTTLEDGVWFVPSLNIQTINGLTDNYITVVEGDGKGGVYLGLRNGLVHRVNARGVVRDTIDMNFGNRLPSPVTAVLNDETTQSLLLSTQSTIALLKGNTLSQVFFPDLLSLSMLVKSENGTYWSRGRSGLYQLSTSQVMYRSSRDNRPLNVTAIHENSEQELWVGSDDGLYEFQAHKFVYQGKRHPLLRHKVLDIASLPDGRLLLATSGAGLVIAKGDSVRALTTADGLTSNLVSAIFVDELGTVWAATNKGLNEITLTATPTIRWYTRRHGLVSNEVQHVYASNGRVWAITNKGASTFRPDQVPRNTVQPRLYITDLKINNLDTVLQEHFRLPYDQNFLRIGFVGLAFRNAGNTPFRYRLEGLETEWQYTTAQQVQYTTLPSGQYEFMLQARNEDGVWSEQAGFSVTITPPFWVTWWFIVICILLIGASTWGIVSYRINQLQDQNRINQELHNYKHQALSAQMNPHFVFNSLNSIQNFILQNDKKEANRYLSKFAKLMRLTLDNSREMYISLEDELSALDLYMELERLRFKNKFDYSITVDPGIDQNDAKIPATLIQPYVENAIWHGIVHKDEQGHVNVEVRQQGEELLCSVQDDGIGRAAAERIKRQHRIKHKSAGMDITQKRLELMNSVHKNEMKHRIIDLQHPDGTAAGTRVEFNIPIVGEEE